MVRSSLVKLSFYTNIEQLDYMKLHKLTLLVLWVYYLPMVAQDLAAHVEVYKQDKYQYKIEQLPINSKAAEFSPIPYKNGFLFCKSKGVKEANQLFKIGNQSTLYYTAFDEQGKLTPPKRFKGKIKKGYEKGPIAISNNTLYLSRNKKLKTRKKEKNTWGIYMADINEEKQQWANIRGFAHNYRQYNITHPALSADGQTLYFSADISKGYGGMDIYKCEKIGNTWTRPQNLGAEINTEADEVYPYIHADGSLYFSSNRTESIGGLDIYKAPFSMGWWSKAEKLAVPINSTGDDFGITFTNDMATKGYLSSSRGGGNGKTDIYAFSIEPVQISKDKEVEIAQEMLQKRREEKQLARKIPAKLSPNYNLLASDNLTTLNRAIGLNQILFHNTTNELLPESKVELDKLVLFLRLNPLLLVELAVHTESRGDDQENLLLSIKRAEAAQSYVTSKGIRTDRVQAYGYGEKYLINFCRNGVSCPDSKHKENNRLEVVIVAGKLTPIPVLKATLDAEQKKATKRSALVLVKNEQTSNRPKEQLFAAPRTEKQRKKTPQKRYRASASNPKLTTNKKAIYQVYVGPFKHIKNELYYQFTQKLKMDVKPKHTSSGMMLTFGNFVSEEEAKHYKQLVNKQLTDDNLQDFVDKKTKASVYKDGKTMEAKKRTFFGF